MFEDDTPIEILNQIKPELLVKGADYTVDQVVGAREVESWGGRVALAELLPGHSTHRHIGAASWIALPSRLQSKI